MRTAGIRFDNDNYINITVTDEGIELYTINAEGKKTEYTVTEKSTRKRKGEE